MLSGFYTATSGMLMQQRYLNVLSDNMANARTPGYRSKRVVSSTFDYELMIRQDGLSPKSFNALSDEAKKAYFARTGIGSGSPIRIVEEVPTEFQQGSMENTNRPYDMGIVGEGFFTVEGKQPLDEEGNPTEALPTQYLTRNGNFNIDEEGFLIMPGVGRVLNDKDGYIKIKGSKFILNADGSILDADGKKAGKLKILNPNFDHLDYMDNACYTINPQKAVNQEGEPIEYKQYDKIKVMQSMLERTNTDVSREMMLAMEVQRSFQACAKALTTVDLMNQKAATQIAAL